MAAPQKNPPKVEKNLENLNKVLRYKAKLVRKIYEFVTVNY